MRHFPTKANSTFTLPRVHPTYADILSGLAQEPVVGRFLLEPPAACPWHDRNGAEAASVRMTAWLERHDPLFAVTAPPPMTLADQRKAKLNAVLSGSYDQKLPSMSAMPGGVSGYEVKKEEPWIGPDGGPIGRGIKRAGDAYQGYIASDAMD